MTVVVENEERGFEKSSEAQKIIHDINNSVFHMNYFNQATWNLKTAFQFYSTASEKGYKESNWRVSAYLRNKIDVEPDYKKSKLLSQKAQAKNLIDGIFMFGFSLSCQDEDGNAFQCFKRLAELNHSYGQFMVG
jgi:TPR repeat protein